MKRGIWRLCFVLTFLILIEVIVYNWSDHKIVIGSGGLDDKSSHSIVPSGRSEKVEPMNVPLIQQFPELPRGCEVTSLAMLLGGAGIKIDKMTLADQVKKNPTPYKEIKGEIYYGDPNNGFVGNMFNINQPGLGVYHLPIFQLAKRYLSDRAIDLTGHGFSKVEEQLSKERPVWVIISPNEQPVPEEHWQIWHTEDGPIKITYQEHSVVLTGYDQNYVYFNDPLASTKNKRALKTDFIAAWKQFGSQAISYN